MLRIGLGGTALHSGELPIAPATDRAASTTPACRIHVNTPTLQDCEAGWRSASPIH
jgi:hypothetical protein